MAPSRTAKDKGEIVQVVIITDRFRQVPGQDMPEGVIVLQHFSWLTPMLTV